MLLNMHYRSTIVHYCIIENYALLNIIKAMVRTNQLHKDIYLDDLHSNF